MNTRSQTRSGGTIARWCILLAAAIALLCLAWLGRGSAALTWIAEHELQLRQVIADNPYESLFGGMLLYYVFSLVPGTSGKAIVFGWLFGLAHGVLIVEVALTAAALTAFFLSRFMLRAAVESRFQRLIARLNQSAEKESAFYLLTLRMLHAPFTLVNYLAGASRVSAFTFAWTTAVGLLPGILCFVFLGTQLPTLHELSVDGPGSLIQPWLMVALIAMGCLPWIIRQLHRLLVNTFSRGDQRDVKGCP